MFLTLIAMMHSKVLCMVTQEMAGATVARRLHFRYSALDLRHHLIPGTDAATVKSASLPRQPNSTARRRVFMLDGPVSRTVQTEQEDHRAFIARHKNPNNICSAFLTCVCAGVCVRPPRWRRSREISRQGGSSQLCQPLFAQI